MPSLRYCAFRRHTKEYCTGVRLMRCSYCNLFEFQQIVRLIEQQKSVPDNLSFPWLERRRQFVENFGEDPVRAKNGWCINSSRDGSFFTCCQGFCLYCILEAIRSCCSLRGGGDQYTLTEILHRGESRFYWFIEMYLYDEEIDNLL